MTDLEISKALALVIGWDAHEMRVNGYLEINVSLIMAVPFWRTFDYRDWNVVGPIAERYDCFPRKTFDYNGYENGWHVRMYGAISDTPQKTIALAVIQGAKK